MSILSRLRRRTVDELLSVYHKLVVELEAAEQYAKDEIERAKNEIIFHSFEATKARKAIDAFKQIV